MANITQIANKIADARRGEISKFTDTFIKQETQELLAAFIKKMRMVHTIAFDINEKDIPRTIRNVTAADVEKFGGKDMTPDEVENAVDSAIDAIISAVTESAVEKADDIVKELEEIAKRQSNVVKESADDVLSDDDPLQKSDYVNTKPVAFRVVLETPRDIDDEEMTAQVMLFSERHPDAELSDFGPTTSGKFYIDVIFYTEQASRKAELENDPEMEVIAVEQYPDSIFSGEVNPTDVGMDEALVDSDLPQTNMKHRIEGYRDNKHIQSLKAKLLRKGFVEKTPKEDDEIAVFEKWEDSHGNIHGSKVAEVIVTFQGIEAMPGYSGLWVWFNSERTGWSGNDPIEEFSTRDV